MYVALCQNALFTGTYSVESVHDMFAYLSNSEFVIRLQYTYPSPWHLILEGICDVLHINKHFNNYVKLKKAIDEIHNHPDYLLAKANDDDKRIVSQIPYYIEEFDSSSE